MVQLVRPEHVSDTLMMRTTLKELKEKTLNNFYFDFTISLVDQSKNDDWNFKSLDKTGFAELLGRTESNHTVDMGQKVYEFIERLRNPEKRANSIGGGQNPMHQQWVSLLY